MVLINDKDRAKPKFIEPLKVAKTIMQVSLGRETKVSGCDVSLLSSIVVNTATGGRISS